MRKEATLAAIFSSEFNDGGEGWSVFGDWLMSRALASDATCAMQGLLPCGCCVVKVLLQAHVSPPQLSLRRFATWLPVAESLSADLAGHQPAYV